MIETNITEEDIKLEGSLRPQTLDDYIGQSKIKENQKVYIIFQRLILSLHNGMDALHLSLAFHKYLFNGFIIPQCILVPVDGSCLF